MKNFKVILFVAASALFASCNDAIDITQPGELIPENTFETVDDLRQGLLGIYGAVPGENDIYFTSVFTDEIAIGKSNGGQGQSGELAFVLNNNSGDASSIWISNYYMINLATRLIVYSNDVAVEEGSADETDKASILAQAHALRAYGHLKLLSYFAEDITNDASKGVIALDFIPAISDQPARNTTGEVFELIDADLDFAEANLVSGGDVKFITTNALKAMRARIALYRKHYDEAMTYATDLISTGPALTTGSQYRNMFTDAANGEIIFKLDRVYTGSQGNFYQYWASVNSTVNGSPFFEVNRALYNLVDIGTANGSLNSAPNDIRRNVIVDPTAFSSNSVLSASALANATYDFYIFRDVLPVGKYPGSNNINFLNDIKVFRMSEIYFIRAEAYAAQNNFVAATDDLNKVRRARMRNATVANAQVYTVPAAGDAQTMWANILKERRIELAFEGHRYIDLRRLGPLAGVGVDRYSLDCSFNGACTLPATDYRFVMPIPRSEITSNSNVVQNPGYSD